MKLPKIQPARPERGAGVDFASIDRKHQATQSLIGAVAGVAESYQDAAASSEYLSSKNQSKRELRVLHDQLNKPLQNVKDLTNYDKADVTVGPDGESYVPTHKVAQSIWQEGTAKIKLSAGEGLKQNRAKNEYGAWWDQTLEQSLATAEGQIDKSARDYFVGKAIEEVNKAVADNDYEAVTESLFFLKKDGYINGDTHRRMLENARNAVNENIKADEIEGYESLLLVDAETPRDVEGLYEAEARLRDKDQFSSLTDKERDNLADALEKKADQNKLSLYAKEEKIKGQLVSNIELAIAANDPRVTLDTIQQLYDDDIITASKMTTMKKAKLAKQKQYSEDLAIDASIQAALSAGIKIDHQNKKQRDAVDRYFESAVVGGADPWQEAISTMKTYGVVPSKVGGLMRGSNRADAPGLLNAAVLYNEAKRSAPYALQDLNTGTDLVQTVAANLNLGMDGPDATQTAIEWAAADEVKKAALLAAYNINAKSDPGALKDLISDETQFDIPWSILNPDVPLTMQIQFDMATKQYVASTGGNVAAAQQKAFADIKSQWTLTDINGDNRLMKYAPQGDNELMRRSIDKDYGEGAMIRSDSLTEIQSREGTTQTYHITRSGDVPEIETKARKGSAQHTIEWREYFEKAAGMSVDELGITNKEEAQTFLSVLYEGDNVVDLGRWEWDAEAAADKENAKAIKEAKASYTKRRDRQEQKEINKAEWTIRNEAVEKGLSPAEYLQSEEGQRRKTFVLESMRAAGGLF